MKKNSHDWRPQKNRSAVIHVFDKKEKEKRLNAESALQEAVALSEALERIDVLYQASIGLTKSAPATLMGSGAINDLKTIFEQEDIDLVIINHDLTPIQQRNLEKIWQVKVIDRTGLILEIFGARAMTKEGSLQVELAALTFQRSRLVRSWTHLERQRGGLGFVGGPGETQIEIDRRLISERIIQIKKELKKVTQTRKNNRKARQKTPYPVVALVGYTNAGKSTLFNTLTKADVRAEDLLFATLDPTMRAVTLANGKEVIFSDTVGFISELPTLLVAAFRATLEEVLEADIILHVRDISNKDHEHQKKEVEAILEELGIDVDNTNRIIEVLNKSDNITPAEKVDWQRYARFSLHTAVLISAVSGEGVENLLQVIEQTIQPVTITKNYELNIKDGKALAWLHSHTDVLTQEVTNENNTMSVTIQAEEKYINQFEKEFLMTG